MITECWTPQSSHIWDTFVFTFCKAIIGMFFSLYTLVYLISYILGNHTRLKLSSKHLFIEVTATDLAKATIVLDTIVAMFSQYCEHPYL